MFFFVSFVVKCTVAVHGFCPDSCILIPDSFIKQEIPDHSGISLTVFDLKSQIKKKQYCGRG